MREKRTNNKSACVPFLVIGLLLSLVANICLYKWRAADGGLLPVASSPYLAEVAKRLGVDIAKGAVDCEVAADILVQLQNDVQVPDETLDKKIVDGICVVLSESDKRIFLRMVECNEQMRGQTVVILPRKDQGK